MRFQDEFIVLSLTTSAGSLLQERMTRLMKADTIFRTAFPLHIQPLLFWYNFFLLIKLLFLYNFFLFLINFFSLIQLLLSDTTSSSDTTSFFFFTHSISSLRGEQIFRVFESAWNSISWQGRRYWTYLDNQRSVWSPSLAICFQSEEVSRLSRSSCGCIFNGVFSWEIRCPSCNWGTNTAPRIPNEVLPTSDTVNMIFSLL